MVRAFIAVGSNIQPAQNVRAALLALAARFECLRISTVYLSQAEGRAEQPAFYNCVVEIETDVAPLDLKFQILRPIEAELGRRRTWNKNAPRTIDLDLILYGDVTLKATELILPDPDITRRPFLAIPLAEIEPDMIIPGTEARISEVAAVFPAGSIQPLEAYTASLLSQRATKVT